MVKRYSEAVPGVAKQFGVCDERTSVSSIPISSVVHSCCANTNEAGRISHNKILLIAFISQENNGRLYGSDACAW